MIALVESGGARSLLTVPMLKERELVGAIAVYRRAVRPFTDKQIELVTNFAASSSRQRSRLNGMAAFAKAGGGNDHRATEAAPRSLSRTQVWILRANFTPTALDRRPRSG